MSRRSRVNALDRATLEAVIRGQGGDLRAVARQLNCALSTVYRAVDKHCLRALAGLPSSGIPATPMNTGAPVNGEKVFSVFAPNRSPRPRLSDVTRTRARTPADRIDTSISVEKNLWREAKKLAIDMDCPISRLVEQALRVFLEQSKSKEV